MKLIKAFRKKKICFGKTEDLALLIASFELGNCI